jgi:hypothetical protein
MRRAAATELKAYPGVVINRVQALNMKYLFRK